MWGACMAPGCPPLTAQGPAARRREPVPLFAGARPGLQRTECETDPGLGRKSRGGSAVRARTARRGPSCGAFQGVVVTVTPRSRKAMGMGVLEARRGADIVPTDASGRVGGLNGWQVLCYLDAQRHPGAGITQW